jgi:hypothetical protein
MAIKHVSAAMNTSHRRSDKGSTCSLKNCVLCNPCQSYMTRAFEPLTCHVIHSNTFNTPTYSTIIYNNLHIFVFCLNKEWAPGKWTAVLLQIKFKPKLKLSQVAICGLSKKKLNLHCFQHFLEFCNPLCGIGHRSCSEFSSVVVNWQPFRVDFNLRNKSLQGPNL